MASAPSARSPEFFFRSLYAGFSFASALATLAAILSLFCVTDWVVRQQSQQSLTRTIDADMSGLADIYATSGRDELLARLGDRMALVPDNGGRPRYLVANATGKRLAGDIARWPNISAENSELRMATLEDGSQVLARGTLLDRNLKLLVARDLSARDALLAHIAHAFALTGCAILVAVLMLGIFAAWRLRQRIDPINRAFRSVEQGRFERLELDLKAPDEIGELARHANRMVARVAQLIDAHRSISDNLAHELRTPLMHLDMRLLKTIEKSVDPRLIETLGSARSEIREIVHMLDSLLDIAASEARRGDPSGLEEIDLSDLCLRLGDMYRESAEESDISLSADIADSVFMRGDKMQLTRMLSNLIDNAFKYAGPSGRIELTLKPGPHLSVSDSGPGIPVASQPHIFDRFVRADGDTRKGHGLGLALAQAIARRHGLAIRYQDAAPGARFVVSPEAEDLA